MTDNPENSNEPSDSASVDNEMVQDLESAFAELKTLLQGSDNAAIKAATEKLMTASQAFSQKLYESAARDTNAAGTSASGQGASDNDIVDAEIVDAEIVDEK